MKLTNNLSREDKKMINSICWRSLNAHCSRVGGQARQMAIGFLWQIMPALNRYYKDQPEKKKEALYRHVQFCNVSNAIYPFLAGLVASMEKENSEVDDFDTSSIVAIKAALMGAAGRNRRFPAVQCRTCHCGRYWYQLCFAGFYPWTDSLLSDL